MAKRKINYPLEQFYDGNAYPNYAPGHLFELNSENALCGRNKQKMSAPVLEKEYDKAESWVTFSINKTCKKCSSIVEKNI